MESKSKMKNVLIKRPSVMIREFFNVHLIFTWVFVLKMYDFSLKVLEKKVVNQYFAVN